MAVIFAGKAVNQDASLGKVFATEGARDVSKTYLSNIPIDYSPSRSFSSRDVGQMTKLFWAISRHICSKGAFPFSCALLITL